MVIKPWIRIGIQLIMLDSDPDLESMNPDPKHCLPARSQVPMVKLFHRKSTSPMGNRRRNRQIPRALNKKGY
jgi:hypothetical protein